MKNIHCPLCGEKLIVSYTIDTSEMEGFDKTNGDYIIERYVCKNIHCKIQPSTSLIAITYPDRETVCSDYDIPFKRNTEWNYLVSNEIYKCTSIMDSDRWKEICFPAFLELDLNNIKESSEKIIDKVMNMKAFL